MRLLPLLLVTFIQSAATAAVEHAIFFYTQSVLGFTVMQNLLLALVFGVMYAAGAYRSHALTEWLARRWPGHGEKAALIGVTLGQILIAGVLTLDARPVWFWLLWPLLGWCNGTHWPIVESYLVAGRTPRRASKAIGQFNVTWSVAVVGSVAVAGLLIAWRPQSLLAMCLALNAVSLLIVAASFPRRAAHLGHDHPERLPADTLARYVPLERSCKWSMLACYTLMFVLGPYLPEVFKQLGVGVERATLLAAVLYGARVVSFFALERWHGWHGLRLPLALGALAMPAGALIVLLGTSVAVVVAGEVVFGLFCGVIYTGSLYYGMALKNASVQGGGDHEGVVGVGFTAGPLLGMAGHKLAGVLGAVGGMTAGLSPIIVVGLLGGLWPLRHRREAVVIEPTAEAVEPPISLL